MIVNTKQMVNPDSYAVRLLGDLLKDVAVIAGGCIVSIVNNKPINDIDIFLIKPVNFHKDILSRLGPYMSSIEPQDISDKYCVYYDVNIPSYTDKINQYKINIIQNGYTSVRQVIDDFDFANVKVYYNTHRKEISGDLHLARLGQPLIVSNIKHPVKLIERINKYIIKGFIFDTTAKVIVAQKLNQWYLENGDNDSYMDTDYIGELRSRRPTNIFAR